MRTILVLMDSLNRHYLRMYGDTRIDTPNMDRVASRGVVMDNHWAGSMPCMPARREIMTGRYNFLETSWSSIQPWDVCGPTLMRKSGIYSHLITDHYHYFQSGGDGYHRLFSSWEYLRGQEFDNWKPVVVPPDAVAESWNLRGEKSHAFRANRAGRDMNDESQYPTVQCFEQAVAFLDANHEADNWHLHLEVFDPHEPFECPEKYLAMYGDDWEGPDFFFPPYSPLEERHSDQAVAHIRRRYAGSLTMADAALGRLLDVMDRYDMWKDTLLILTTDHGHLLGEHGYWAKNYMYDYAELVHIPCVVCTPGLEPGHRSGLSATIDLMPTFLEAHGIDLPLGLHGAPMQSVLEHDESKHDHVLYGYFGKDVSITDGHTVYTRQPLDGAVCHLHTGFVGDAYRPGGDPGAVEFGNFLPGARTPQFRVPLKSKRHHDAPQSHLLFDLDADPMQQAPLADEAREDAMVKAMWAALEEADAPECQYSRLAGGVKDASS